MESGGQCNIHGSQEDLNLKIEPDELNEELIEKSNINTGAAEEAAAAAADANLLEITSQDTPELEMREEVNASPTPEGIDFQTADEADKQNKNCEENSSSSDEETTLLKWQDMKNIILTQGQLKLLTTADLETFRRVAIGSFVRVFVPGLPQGYTDRVFIDEIVDIVEPQSYQHFWLNRRFRLRFLGDTEIEKIVGLKIQQENELRAWFDCMNAKGETLPSYDFVNTKAAEIEMTLKDLMEKQKFEEANKQKILIKRDNLAQIALNPTMLRDLAKLDFGRFREVVTGCFVCMPAIRKEKSKNCQYHILKVLDCLEGPRSYKIKNVATVNYQLVLPFYGRYIINWMKSFSSVSDEGFRIWIEDMRSWKEQLPTLEEIRTKAAELQLALTQAQKMPSIAELEKARSEEEERAKRAKLLVESADDLMPSFLTRQQLQKLSAMDDTEALIKLLTGCFVRLSATNGSGGFELDQIMSAKITEQKRNRPAEKLLELKFMGTVSLVALIQLVSTTKMTEQDFKNWVDKNKEDEDDPLPTNEVVLKKASELEKVLGTIQNGDKQLKPSPTIVAKSSSPEKAKEKVVQKNSGPSVDKIENQNAVDQFSLPTKEGRLTVYEFRKCLLSMTKMIDMMAWSKEILARVIKGFYVRIVAKRPEKSQAQQWFIDQVSGVSWGGEPYRIRGNVLTDIRLHLRNLGEKQLFHMYKDQVGGNFNDDSFKLFAEDMANWKQLLPTFSFIESKQRDFAAAVIKMQRVSKRRNTNEPHEMAFLSSQRRYQASNTPSLNPDFEQLQQLIQKKVVSSVRNTPGMHRNSTNVIGTTTPWMNVPAEQQQTFTPITSFPQKAPQPPLPLMQQYAADPYSGGGGGESLNWQQQQKTLPSFVNSPSIGTKKQLFQDAVITAAERESWRMPRTSNEYEQSGGISRGEQYGAFSGMDHHPSYRSTTAASDARGLASLRDLSTAVSDSRSPQYQGSFYASNYDNRYGPPTPLNSSSDGGQQQQQHSLRRVDDERIPSLLNQFESPTFVGSSASILHHQFGNSGYMPSSKRARMSPQAPPVERFF